MTTNHERAVWAREAVVAFQDVKGESGFESLCPKDRDDAMSDLIADLDRASLPAGPQAPVPWSAPPEVDSFRRRF
jgi:hypothetical protein